VTRQPAEPRRFVIVTGMSGAGLSTTLDALEDLGYEAVDNLPLFLFDLLLREGESRDRPLAIVIDSRTRDFSADALLDRVHALRAGRAVAVSLVCVEADDEALLRRYNETRRRHPLALDRPVIDGIRNERCLLEPIGMAADLVVDTSDLSIHDLRRIVAGRFSLERTPELAVFVISFSYRKGLPRDADLVFDVRFLRNPHWDIELRPFTGLDPRVAAYIEGDPECAAFVERLTGFVGPILARYRVEDKTYLTVAVGCTGGRHRSVYVAERLAGWLREQGIKVDVSHRGLAAAGGAIA
jgi:UPF0042 nucleotide-binding protein